jgi:acetyl esterase/lipase
MFKLHMTRHQLREAGVPVTAKRFDGMIHGFIQFFVVQEEAVEALDRMTSFIHEKALTNSKLSLLLVFS